MAAVIITTGPAEDRRPSHSHPPPPRLRVIDGGRSARQRARQRVFWRRRLVVASAVLAVALVVALAAVGAHSVLRSPASPGSASAATAAPMPVAAEAYVVQPGDTLWDIARSLSPSGDVRPVVDELADRAGSSVLQTGQRIDVRGLAD